MMRIWSHDTSANIYDLHTYVCPDCKSWHVGHKSYYEKTIQNPVPVSPATVNPSVVNSTDGIQPDRAV